MNQNKIKIIHSAKLKLKSFVGMQIVVVAMLLDFNSIAAATGRTVGNGGDVLVCQKPDVQGQTLELLDYYEGRTLHALQIDLGASELSVNAKLALVLERLERVSAKRAQRYREQVKNFLTETLFLDDAQLIDISDSDHIMIPSHCVLKQIANQSTPIYSDDHRYLIDKKLWEQLDNNNKAGLILHELIYREALELGHSNSVASRLLNSNMSSLKINNMSVAEYSKLLHDLGFTSTTIQGVEVRLDEEANAILEFFANGNLKTASVTATASIDWQGQTLALRDRIEFYQQGQVRRIFLRDRQSHELTKQKIVFAPYEMSFYADGSLASMTLGSLWQWHSSNSELYLEGVISWYPNGQVAQANVKQGQIKVAETWYAVQSLIGFHENGVAKEFELKGVAKVFWHEQVLKVYGRVMLNETGQLKVAILSEPAKLFTHARQIVFKAYYPLHFSEDSGDVVSGCLGESLLLKDSQDRWQKLEAGQVIRWDSEGRVLADPYKSC